MRNIAWISNLPDDPDNRAMMDQRIELIRCLDRKWICAVQIEIQGALSVVDRDWPHFGELWYHATRVGCGLIYVIGAQKIIDRLYPDKKGEDWRDNEANPIALTNRQYAGELEKVQSVLDPLSIYFENEPHGIIDAENVYQSPQQRKRIGREFFQANAQQIGDVFRDSGCAIYTGGSLDPIGTPNRTEEWLGCFARDGMPILAPWPYYKSTQEKVWPTADALRGYVANRAHVGSYRAPIVLSGFNFESGGPYPRMTYEEMLKVESGRSRWIFTNENGVADFIAQRKALLSKERAA